MVWIFFLIITSITIYRKLQLQYTLKKKKMHLPPRPPPKKKKKFPYFFSFASMFKRWQCPLTKFMKLSYRGLPQTIFFLKLFLRGILRIFLLKNQCATHVGWFSLENIDLANKSVILTISEI